MIRLSVPPPVFVALPSRSIHLRRYGPPLLSSFVFLPPFYPPAVRRPPFFVYPETSTTVIPRCPNTETFKYPTTSFFSKQATVFNYHSRVICWSLPFWTLGNVPNTKYSAPCQSDFPPSFPLLKSRPFSKPAFFSLSFTQCPRISVPLPSHTLHGRARGHDTPFLLFSLFQTRLNGSKRCRGFSAPFSPPFPPVFSGLEKQLPFFKSPGFLLCRYRRP